MDQDGETSIDQIIQDIEGNNYFDDKQIEKDLKEQLEKFYEDRRVQYIYDLHQKFQGRSFLNLPYFNIISTPNRDNHLPEEDLVEIYNQALKQKQFNQILQRITNPQFCEKNQIPVSIKDHKKTLEKLGQNVELIFDLIEQQKGTIRYSYMKSLELLLKIFQLNDEIHQFVGSCLELQLYEFELYVDNFKEKDNDAYQQVIENIQLIQLKDKMKEELDQILSQKTQNFDLCDLLSIEIDDYHQKLLEYIKNYPNIEYNNQDKTKIIRFFNMTENFSNLVDILYFKLVIYFWIKHSEKFELQKFLNDMYEYKLKKAANKRRYMERVLQSLVNQYTDLIFQYLIHKMVLYSNFEDKNFRKNYQKYKQQFEKIQYQQYTFESIKTQLNNPEQLNKIWNDIGQLKFYQLKQLYGRNNEETVFFQFVSTNDYSQKMIEELNLILKHNGNLFEFKNEIFKQTNSQNQDILLQNLLHLKFMLRYKNAKTQKNPLTISKWISQINLIEEYPQSSQIKLNEFNLTLKQENPEISKQIINDWLSDRKDHKKFRNLIPFYFNIIKRGEPSQYLLDLINNGRKKFDKMDPLNMKSLFQILYNNADQELQSILIKLYSKNHSVPLIYKNPLIQNVTKDLDLFRLNENIYYLLEQDYTIINFSLSKNQEKIGKTELINKLFYKYDKFEICDSSLINKNTIDCTFDFDFKRSRNFFIADAHGSFQDELLQQLLPFFQFWIIQMKSEQELKENVDRVNNILSLLDCKPMICFLIRDSENVEIKMEQINQIKASKIEILQIQSFQNMDQQPKNEEIKQMRNKILNMIGRENELVKEQDLKQSFLQVCMNFQINTFKILKIQKLIDNLEIELNIIKSDPEGFYNKKAFPLRCLEWKIQELRVQICECDKEIKSNQQILQDKEISINYLKQQYEGQDETIKKSSIIVIEAKLREKDEINKNQESLKKQKSKMIEKIQQLESQRKSLKVEPSELLSIFRSLFELDNYYIGYQMAVEKIAKFNHTLQLENYTQIEKLKEYNNLIGNNQDESDKQIKTLQNKLYKFQSVSIELFWREIINGYPHFNLNYLDIIVKLLWKGESCEFLNGDDLTINFQFLKQLGEKLMTNKEQNKILIISILGPQSSGKSTLLNKMFGCQFLASVGRCTKGMYLQLLKISDKEQFDNLYDYILLLDSEGLQSSNQQDQVFDKRLALFIVSISDIIIFNIKGEIYAPFLNLIEMCLLTLVEHQKLSNNKQFSWCFNQNEDTSTSAKKILHKQIEAVAEKLKEEKKWQQDVYEISGFREEDTEILGMASKSEKWNDQSCQTHSQEWKQDQINEVYSKEAYQMGINLILRYIHRCKTFIKETEQFLTWERFTKKFEECWEIISRFPDVVEFVELKQQKEYKELSKILNEIISKREKLFSEQVFSLINDIRYEIKKQQKLSTNQLQDIKEKIKDDFQKNIVQIKIQILEEFSTAHKKKNLAFNNNMLMKVSDHVQELISSHTLEGILVIQQEISKQQIQFQYQQIEKQVNKALSKILDDEQKIKSIKTDKESRENHFKQIWMEILDKSYEQIESIYNQFQEQLIESICQFSKSYVYNLDEKEIIQNIFSQNINKSNPDDVDEIFRERLSYQLFQFEFEKQSFVYLNRESPIDYLNIFNNPIKQRIQNIPDHCIIDPKNFIEVNQIYQIIEKSKFISHLQNQFGHFTQQLLLIQEKDQFEEVISNFFEFIKKLEIDFDETQFQSLKDMMKPHPNQNNYINNGQVVELLKCIVQTFKLNSENIKCQQLQDYNLKFFRDYFPDFIKQSEMVLNQLQEDQTNCIIILERCEYKNKLDHGSRYYNFIEFIISKETKFIDEKTFRQEFPDEFNEIMKKSGGWDRLSWGIYQLIKKEIMSQYMHADSMIATLISKEEDVTQINFQLISRIMRKVKDLLNQFNKQFAFFGIQISQLLERKLYYYSIFLIWRFICYKKWAIYYQEKQKLNQVLKEMKEIFDDEILSNNKEVSIRKGKLLAQCIYQNLISQQYSEIQPKIQQYLNSQSIKSYEVVYMLDQKLLIRKEKFHWMNKDLNEQIRQYVYRHKEFIEQFVYLEIQRFKVETITVFEKECSIQAILDIILQNAKELKQQFQNSSDNKNLKLFDYFGDQNLDQESQEKKIIQAILDVKLGEQAENQNYFQNSDIFDNQSIKRFAIPGVKTLSYKVDAFLESFIMEIEALKIQKVQPQIEKFNVQNILDCIQNDMIGCDQSCPMCNRKCDSDDYRNRNHTHKCLNGHQLRGMNRVLINSYPSPYTCEEIIDEAIIKIYETKKVKLWSEVKKIYKDWSFKDYQSQKQVEENKQKMIKIWNGGVGELISKDLQKQFKQEIVFQPMLDVPMNQQNHSYHYIFILDNSDSMRQHWQSVKNCMAEQFEQIKKKKNAKVSVIIFGGTAKTVINCQAVDIDKQIRLIQYEGSWFTLFGPALSAARELVLQHSEFKYTMILFYTDGLPSRFINYSQSDEVNRFCNIEKRFRDSIYFFACSQPNVSSSLQRIIDRFSQAFAQAALRDRIKPIQLNHIWTEIISKNYHRCLA